MKQNYFVFFLKLTKKMLLKWCWLLNWDNYVHRSPWLITKKLNDNNAIKFGWIILILFVAYGRDEVLLLLRQLCHLHRFLSVHPAVPKIFLRVRLWTKKICNRVMVIIRLLFHIVSFIKKKYFFLNGPAIKRRTFFCGFPYDSWKT